VLEDFFWFTLIDKLNHLFSNGWWIINIPLLFSIFETFDNCFYFSWWSHSLEKLILYASVDFTFQIDFSSQRQIHEINTYSIVQLRRSRKRKNSRHFLEMNRLEFQIHSNILQLRCCFLSFRTNSFEKNFGDRICWNTEKSFFSTNPSHCFRLVQSNLNVSTVQLNTCTILCKI